MIFPKITFLEKWISKNEYSEKENSSYVCSYFNQHFFIKFDNHLGNNLYCEKVSLGEDCLK